MKRRALVLLLAFAGAGCPEPAAGPIVVTIRGTKVTLENYRKDPERRYATVRHSRLEDDRGILCSWDRDRILHLFCDGASANFNVVFVDNGGKVVDIQDLGKADDRGVTSAVPASRALVLHEGWAGRHGLETGQSIDLGPAKGEPMPVLTIDGHAVHVETAHTGAEQTRGLMHRPRLSPNDGMIFTYRGEEGRSFWMHNTVLDLDIAYFNKKGELVRVAPTRAAKDPYNNGKNITVPSGQPAQFVLEVNYGWFAAKGITDAEGALKKSVTIVIPEAVRALADRAEKP